ncbi:MAG: beta-ketoacyl-ACP synthase [Hyphomicrobiaceae bacterium]|nr:MAG: beta-ketoacyl-ACP synthase [Hyphomicrobiaceae bacterium]
MLDQADEVWITGVGLVSSLGDGSEAHTDILTGRRDGMPAVDETTFAPYPVHRLVPLDLSKQIPKNSDQRQMEGWQKLGVYAAGLALDDAGIKGKADLLDRTDLAVAAGSGERDTAVDCKVLETASAGGDTPLRANEILPSALRPTLFLAQLSNLLAGNISIVHHVTGGSRTFMGEETAGLAAIESAFRRVAAGQCEICLVGGALNAERADLLLGYELGHNLWHHPFQHIEERTHRGGGFVPGSVGAFLVLEQRGHAQGRAARPYARLTAVESDRGRREPNPSANPLAQVFARVGSPTGQEATSVFSGASGVAPATAGELSFLQGLTRSGGINCAWTYGDLIGHSVEAHFPAGIALAALALRGEGLSAALAGKKCNADDVAPIDRIIVTTVGHYRGEGLAVLERIS